MGETFYHIAVVWKADHKPDRKQMAKIRKVGLRHNASHAAEMAALELSKLTGCARVDVYHSLMSARFVEGRSVNYPKNWKER